jgi:hypothetical protein
MTGYYTSAPNNLPIFASVLAATVVCCPDNNLANILKNNIH